MHDLLRGPNTCSIPRPGTIWAEFVVGSHPCSKGFSLSPPVFPPPQKATFQIPIQPGNSGQEETPPGLSTVKSFKYLYYYHYLIIIKYFLLTLLSGVESSF